MREATCVNRAGGFLGVAKGGETWYTTLVAKADALVSRFDHGELMAQMVRGQEGQMFS